MGNIYSAALFSSTCEMKLTDQRKLLSGQRSSSDDTTGFDAVSPEAIIGHGCHGNHFAENRYRHRSMTRFIGHKGKGKNKRKMVGRAFKYELGRNYRERVQVLYVPPKKKITHYTTVEGSMFSRLRFFNAVQRSKTRDRYRTS